jgi:hypothetical protein
MNPFSANRLIEKWVKKLIEFFNTFRFAVVVGGDDFYG